MNKKIRESQKPTTPLGSYLHRKVSPYFTNILIKAGLNPEPVCLSWGLINVLNSYFIYRALLGEYLFIPIFLAIHIFTEILDVVDGEIARYRNRINPISGKLFDGIGHRMTEYSILIAFIFGVYHRTGSEFCLFIGLFAFFGEAMYTYCNERKLLVVRLYAKEEAHERMSTNIKRYPVNSKWSSFRVSEKIDCIKGLFVFRQVYFMVTLSFCTSIIITIGFVILAIHKNISWLKIIYKLLNNPPELREGAVDKAAYWTKKPEVKEDNRIGNQHQSK